MSKTLNTTINTNEPMSSGTLKQNTRLNENESDFKTSSDAFEQHLAENRSHAENKENFEANMVQNKHNIILNDLPMEKANEPSMNTTFTSVRRESLTRPLNPQSLRRTSLNNMT